MAGHRDLYHQLDSQGLEAFACYEGFTLPEVGDISMVLNSNALILLAAPNGTSPTITSLQMAPKGAEIVVPNHDYSLLDEFDKQDKGVKTILNEHPEVKILFERRHNLPDQVEINGVNPILHVLMEGVVENQLQDQIIPEVKEAVERLESKGLSRHAPRACVTRVFIEFFHEAFHQRKIFDNDRYRRKLRLLGTDPRKIGRNEPCPCGSGVIFKRCCGTDVEQFKISRINSRCPLPGSGKLYPRHP